MTTPQSQRNLLSNRSNTDVSLSGTVTQQFELQQKWINSYYIHALLVFTIIYNIIEGGVAIYWGLDDEAISLFGFGIDSLIEVFSSSIVFGSMYYEMRRKAKTLGKSNKSNSSMSQMSQFLSLENERKATLSIGILLIILALTAFVGSIIRLAARESPDSTLVGIIISSASLSFMFFLWYYKTKAAVILDSSTLTSDANCSLGCIKLSCILFLGSLIYMISEKLWWVDAVTALIMSIVIFYEGYSTIKESMREDFSGGCGCCSGSDTWLAKRLRKEYSFSNMDTPKLGQTEIEVIGETKDKACKKGCCSDKPKTEKETPETNVNGTSNKCQKACCGETETETINPSETETKAKTKCSKGCCGKNKNASNDSKPNEETQSLMNEGELNDSNVNGTTETTTKPKCKKGCCGGKNKNKNKESQNESNMEPTENEETPVTENEEMETVVTVETVETEEPKGKCKKGCCGSNETNNGVPKDEINTEIQVEISE